MNNKLLDKVISIRIKVTGTVDNIRKKDGYNSFLQDEILLTNIFDDNDRHLFDKIPINFSKKLKSLNLEKGDRLSFYAKLDRYEVIDGGFKNPKNGKISIHYQLSNPTKYSLIKHQ